MNWLHFYVESFLIKVLWSTKSNAFLKSMNIDPTRSTDQLILLKLFGSYVFWRNPD